MTEGTGRRRIYLMRHGHVDYFAEDATDVRAVPLTAEGRAQAGAAGEALSKTPLDLAVCSGLPRTRETAEIVLSAREKALPLGAVADLEELKSGTAQAKTREELAARLAYCFDDAGNPDACFLPGGERFEDAFTRVRRGLSTLVTTGAWRSALVVAHEGVNRLALAWACGGGLATAGAFEQDLGCINVLDFDVTPDGKGGLMVERAIVKAMNVTPYDYVKHGLSRTSLEHLFDIDFGAARPARAQG